ASFGYKREKGQKTTFELGDGLIGQCAKDMRPVVLKDLPEGYRHVETGTGSMPVDTIYLYPVIQNNQLFGVIELGRFGEFGDLEQSLLKAVIPVVSVYLENLARAAKTESLLVRSQNQAEELRASEEELRSQSEEIRLSNEQLRARTEQLAQKTSELQASEEELRIGNEELSEKTRALELRQEELRQAKQDAEIYAEEMRRANQYKSQFLANMSHELRTPLNSLLILARILADNKEGNLTEDDVEAAGIIHDSGQHLLNLINDILDLSKTEAGKTELLPEEVQLSDVMAIIKNNFDHLAREKKVEFKIEATDEAATQLYIDRTKLQQILNNLLSNAFKFTEEGSVRFCVSAASDEELEAAGINNPDTDYLSFLVEDSGIGMTEKQLSTVFEAFRQADGSTSRKYGGTGLGLTITRSLCELMGGQVVVKSELNVGSKFYVYLPARFEGNGEVSALPSQPSDSVPANPKEISAPETKDLDTSISATSSQSMVTSEEEIPVDVDDDRYDETPNLEKILIIEDDPNFAGILMRQVREKGFGAVVSYGATNGLKLAAKIQPCGIILDINLPDLNGWDVLEKLKDDVRTKYIPVHILSSDDDPGDAVEKGAAAFTTKPSDPEKLQEVLAQIMAASAQGGKQVLLIEDDYASQVAIGKIMKANNIDMIAAGSSEEGIQILKEHKIDCIVLDLGLPDIDGFEFLAKANEETGHHVPPVVIYSGRELDSEELAQLREYTDSVVIKGARSAERLLSEVTLFLHSVENKLPEQSQANIAKTKAKAKNKVATESGFFGRHVLLVDDDMRNVFALSKVLKDYGCKVTIAKN
ncbi:MAG: response regulator, partial [Alphaproteobacteria bacterium]|nr:response regulator [Alphaproteobacteria bacterium]